MLPKREPSGLQMAIDEIYSEMKGFTADSDEYAKMVDQLMKLHSMHTVEKAHRLNPNTIATLAANFGGIAMILHYERIHVITSKALNFVIKLR